MKTAKTLTELAQEVERQEISKKDFLGNTTRIKLNPDLSLNLGNGKEYPVTKHCHSQIATRLGIPKKYYDRMLLDSPDLLSNNVNHWFANKPEDQNDYDDATMLERMGGNIVELNPKDWKAIAQTV